MLESINQELWDKKLKSTMRFYLLATRLKYKIRTGWDQSLYSDDEKFSALLNFVKDNTLTDF